MNSLNKSVWGDRSKSSDTSADIPAEAEIVNAQETAGASDPGRANVPATTWEKVLFPVVVYTIDQVLSIRRSSSG